MEGSEGESGGRGEREGGGGEEGRGGGGEEGEGGGGGRIEGERASRWRTGGMRRGEDEDTRRAHTQNERMI